MRATVAIWPFQAVFSSEVHGGQRVTFRRRSSNSTGIPLLLELGPALLDCNLARQRHSAAVRCLPSICVSVYQRQSPETTTAPDVPSEGRMKSP
jgi:hypothetical protein